MNENKMTPQPGTLEGALSLVRSGDTIATSIYGSEPTGFLKNLHTIAPRVHDVTLWTMLTMGRYPVMYDVSLKGHIDILTFFYNQDCRKGHESGRYGLVPMNLHSVGMSIVASKRPTIFVAAVSPADEAGNVYLSFDLQASRECMDAADTVIFEINPNIPRIYGETAIPIQRADYTYVYSTPLPEAPVVTPTAEDTAIAEAVASLVQDGDCIQLGIGGIPNAIGLALAEKRDLGIHTDMITASMGHLIRVGAVTNNRKNVDRGKTVGAFAYGDLALYQTLRDNDHVELRRAAYTNDPAQIAKQDNMVSVNTALQIDLTGQICSESIGYLQYSGTGGASDFAYGAFHSKNGRGIIAIHATTKNGTVSKIVPQLSPGAIVSISRNLADYVITEYGVARLRERSVRQRVENLIAIAAPEFRGELKRQAEQMLLW